MERSSKNNKRKFFLFGAVLALVAFFCLGYLFFLSKPLHSLGAPIWRLKNYSSEIICNATAVVQSKKMLSEENAKLKSELNKINSRLLNNKLLLMENRELKEMWGRRNEDLKFILADVLAKPNLSPYDTLILDIGENYGAQKGDKVLANASVVIGEIEDVYARTAKVKLYSFPNNTLSVAIGFNKIISVAEGKGGGNFEVKLPREISVEKGDVVVLPEMDLFILGVVEDITTVPENPLQIILFKIPINIFELRWVQILQK